MTNHLCRRFELTMTRARVCPAGSNGPLDGQRDKGSTLDPSEWTVVYYGCNGNWGVAGWGWGWVVFVWSGGRGVNERG